MLLMAASTTMRDYSTLATLSNRERALRVRWCAVAVMSRHS